MKNNEYDEIIEYYYTIIKLKKTIRKGWELRKIPNPESVADHVFGVTNLALLFAKKLNLDVEKTLTTALLHEVCECTVGDITPHDGVPSEEKSKLEEKAAFNILSKIDPTLYLFELWKDFEYERTNEGKLVKELDRLEMALQASDYQISTGTNLEEFFNFSMELG